MIEHIVKNNESLVDILNMYHIEFNELRQQNSHITDFNRLVSGTKLLIPLISDEVEQVLEKTEGFVMEYYPKITDEIIPSLNENKLFNVEEEVKKEEPKPQEKEYRQFEQLKMPYPGIIPPKNPYKGR